MIASALAIGLLGGAIGWWACRYWDYFTWRRERRAFEQEQLRSLLENDEG